jgi:hypothetical protein
MARSENRMGFDDVALTGNASGVHNVRSAVVIRTNRSSRNKF